LGSTIDTHNPQGRNESYATLVEASLARASMEQSDRSRQDVDLGLESRATGIAPPHFYRELTRTAEGCMLLKESGHFLEFVSTIRNFWAEKDDQEIVLKVKGCLWAVGNIGSMELGAYFLEHTDVILWIVKMAESSEVMTLRGTAVFVLGLISRSLHGLELLNEFGWDSKTTIMGQSLGLCIPGNIHTFFSVCCGRFLQLLPPSDPFLDESMEACQQCGLGTADRRRIDVHFERQRPGQRANSQFGRRPG